MKIQERQRISTPENVQLSLTLAGIGSRFGAALIDLIIQLVLLYLLLIVLGLVAGFIGAAVEIAGYVVIGLTIVAVFVVWFLYHLILEWAWHGKTVGKAAMRIHVTRDGGLPLTPSAVVIRNLLRIVDFLPVFYPVGLFTLLTNKSRKRVGDHLGGTIVVKNDRPEPGSGPVRVSALPYGYAWTWDRWDLSALSDDDEMLIRRFLQRRYKLSPAARWHTGNRLASYIRPKIFGNVPDQPPEALLEGIELALAQRPGHQLALPILVVPTQR